MRDENVLYWIWLSEKCGAASKDFGRLMSRYDNPFDIYRLEDDEVEQITVIGNALKSRLTDKSLESSYAVLRYCKQKGISVIGYSDERYPKRLREIEDPPVLLYVLGNLPDMNSRLCIGMVGTRKMSEYGCRSSYKIAYELASANAVVVSGMARGVDGVSACGAISAGGSTVAVLGSGLSVVYPKEHNRLFKKILENGAVISEYPPNERPYGYNFPKRNRIISGISQGVLVVEGDSESGAMITATKAISQGRELFAMPGKIDELNSDGPNELIKDGAIVTLGAEDILTHYDLIYRDCINYRDYRRSKTDFLPMAEGMKLCGIADIYIGDSSKNTMESARAPQHSAVKKEAEVEVRSASDVVDSDKALSCVDDNSKKVFNAMPLSEAVTADTLALDDMDVGDIITAFTMLEIAGLVESLPGGAYIRK